jgi:membrane fusion protein, copper/silver efflux system
MTRFWLNIILIAVLTLGLTGCKEKPHTDKTQLGTEQQQKILYYTCPMHRFIHKDKPGNCPICGMELIPIFAEEPHEHGGTETQPSQVMDRSPLTLSKERQQLIGVMTETVVRRSLIREIEASGRVAFDPDLYTAQNDYLIARRTSGGELNGLQGQLVQAARARLILLGMSDSQIRDLESHGKAQRSLVVPQPGESVWIYASLFEADFPFVSTGTAVEVTLPNSGKVLSTSVASIDPVINPNTRTAQARFKLANESGELRPGMFLQAKISADLGTMLVVPTVAVLDTGKRQLVYLKVGEGRFEPREIKLGRRGSHEAEVLSGLNEGDQVVTQGTFLLDSESSLRSSITESTGGHQH